MSVITNNLLFGDEGYFLERSLRFRASASAYLNRTPASAGNRKTWTFSTWIKLGEIAASNGTILSAGTASGVSTRFYLRYTGSQFQTGYGSQNLDTTVAVYRDPSAWYHLVLAIDTTQATAANRLKIYVNGVQQTVTTSVNYSQNDDTAINNNVAQNIGRDLVIPGGYFDGYLAETYIIDGQALTPSSFGETSAITGVWQPIKYTGTYGTNGFYLPFTDNSALTTSSNAGLGKDFSGNANYWTTNNISITSGSTYDSMTDVPTLTSATAANFCTWNPLAVGTNITTASGNLNATASSNSNAMLQATFGITSGKWYWEVTLSSGTSAWAGSIIKSTAGLNYSSLSSGDAYSYSNDGSKYNGQTSTSYGNTYTTNDVISVAYNADTGKIWFAKNGTWQASGDPAAGTNEAYSSISGTYMPSALLNSATGIANFGQRPFAYTPPSGFKALNTFNLPTPTIGATASTQANKYMDISLYTGTGSSQSITGLNFQPDWTWIKGRSGATDHGLYDAVRGVQLQLESNTTTAETTETTGLTAFNSNGFTVGALAQLNTSSATYVGWNWKANGAGVTNTAGTITSTVSANTTAGFSIATLTTQSSGTGTFGHGLGVAPSMVICKYTSTTSNWFTWHTSIAGTDYLTLNTTSATTNNSVIFSAAPTSTVVNLGTAWAGSGQIVAYCFAEVAGYSKFGSYTGNGSSDGVFVYLGFRPKYFMWKRTDTSGNSWFIVDSSRSPYNTAGLYLCPDLSNAEGSGATMDLLSNGMKIQGDTSSSTNANGATYIYMAFAEFPFKFANGR
jgi:hypothetical protein